MSKPSVLNILQRFKTAYMQFIDELLQLFPTEPDIIIIRVFFEDQIPVSMVADSFINNVLPHKDMIKNRNEKFFLENNHMFGMLDGEKVLHFKKLWTSKNIDDDDRLAIWQWFDTFIALIEAYSKCRN
jgi:hypothetical protein